MRRARILAVTVTLAVLAAACGGESATQAGPVPDIGVRVASFDFVENRLLAEMYAQVIESTGVPVERMGPVGPREIIAPAMELGRIDLVPEYLGSLLTYLNAAERDSDAGAVGIDINGLIEPRGLAAMEPSPAQDKKVFVVTVETAARDELESISDLSLLAGSMKFGGPIECSDRPLCLAGLNSVYGLEFAEFVPQRSLAFTSEALRRGEIDIGLLFSTAAELIDPALVALADDLKMQPDENIVPIVRADVLESWGPEVAEALDNLSARLTTNELRRLNFRVAEGGAIEEVARQWLVENELLGQD